MGAQLAPRDPSILSYQKKIIKFFDSLVKFLKLIENKVI